MAKIGEKSGIVANTNADGVQGSKVYGMIDGNAYYSSLNTWPLPLLAILDKKRGQSRDTIEANIKDKFDSETEKKKNNTEKLAGQLVNSNSAMYSELNSNLNQNRRYNPREVIADNKDKNKPIPSLIITPTMDMELAHIGGYGCDEQGVTEKIFISNANDADFCKWEQHIEDIEQAVVSNPLRLFPLFSYDPRRYRYAEYMQKPSFRNLIKIKDCGTWKEPFTRIIGHKDKDKDTKKLWLGFSMNPLLGFRPFDELCEYLPDFYKECEDNAIPILAYCAIEEIRTHDAELYMDRVDKNDDMRKQRMDNHKNWLESGKWPTMDLATSVPVSDNYFGEEPFIYVEHKKRFHFYSNYGHPKNWLPVLQNFPKLHLCLSHFGGNARWKEGGCFKDNSRCFESEWINTIIELTRRYENVYVDISGLNIYNKEVKASFLGMLDLIKECEHCTLFGNCGQSYKHLKNKLIFGSNWYSICLFNNINEMNIMNETDKKDNTDGSKATYNYQNYITRFKELFDEVDKNWEAPARSFWEYVSLINPWNFYGLGKKGDERNSKIKKMYAVLKNAPKIQPAQLKAMHDILIDDNNPDAVVKHIPPSNIQTANASSSKIRICGQPEAISNGIFAKNKINHYPGIIDILKKNLAGNGHKAYELFMKMAPKLKIVSANYVKYQSYLAKGSDGKKLEIYYDPTFGSFSREKKAIYTNIETDALLTDVDLPRGHYQVTIHELWHNIDYLAGEKDKAGTYFSHFYGGGILAKTIEKDIAEWIKKYPLPKGSNYRSRQGFYNYFSDVRPSSINKDKLNAYDLAYDIFDGARCVYNRGKEKNGQITWKGKYLGIRDKGGKYWEEDGILAAECFANFGGAAGSSPDALKILAEYLPQTYRMYNAIIDDLWKHFC